MDNRFLTDWDDFTMPDKMELCKIDPPSKFTFGGDIQPICKQGAQTTFSLYNFHDDIYPNAYLFFAFYVSVTVFQTFIKRK